MKVEAYPAAGKLEPGRTAPVTIKLTSFDVPCEMRLNVPCKFLDETQYSEHQASLMAYYDRSRKSQLLFEYTENNESEVVGRPN